jgi:hypothetical protein
MVVQHSFLPDLEGIPRAASIARISIDAARKKRYSPFGLSTLGAPDKGAFVNLFWLVFFLIRWMIPATVYLVRFSSRPISE